MQELIPESGGRLLRKPFVSRELIAFARENRGRRSRVVHDAAQSLLT